jgi:hypothetical protein
VEEVDVDFEVVVKYEVLPPHPKTKALYGVRSTVQ